ncbi:MAG: hypothetical protein Q7J09_04960 [Methanocalculus sp.]|uniref:hypothetical protein n=1 Tax=Methanocalculus sp. TaxID=2004547 RepID=UPI00271F103C|nr:hypothetical protein [Methanocalculus sp.]MDO9539335.1 hypothetical protein [Methanocalculus sp.]
MNGFSRCITLLAVMVLVIGGLLVAGCTDTTSHGREADWSGVWIDTSVDHGALRLTQTGDRVTGTYFFGETLGTMEGTVSGNGAILTGTWAQDDGKGSYELTMSVDRQEFTGWWTEIEDTDESLQYLWTGYRAPPVSWTGTWLDDKKDFGEMLLTQEGRTVSGTFSYENTNIGTVTGTISNDGYVFTGIWAADEDEGPFELTMEDTQSRFTGWWMHDELSATRYSWNGLRREE